MLIVSKKISSEVLSNSLHNIECSPVLIIFLRWKNCNMLKEPMGLKCGVTQDVNPVFYCSENKCMLVVQMMKESGGVKVCLKFRLFGIGRYLDVLKIFADHLLSYSSASGCMIDSFTVRLTEASQLLPPSFLFLL